MTSDRPDPWDWDEDAWAEIQSQVEYVEFDWFGVDREGHLAMFSSYGVGPSPPGVRDSRSRFNQLQRVIVGLPVVTTAVLEPTVDFRTTEDWTEAARRGLFAYDIDDRHDTKSAYTRIAVPSSPIHIDSVTLPEALLPALPRLHASFATATSIPFGDIR